jgi:hypothetical protein
MAQTKHFFRHGGKIAWGLILAVFILMGAGTTLLASTAEVRYQRDVTRMVFNDNVELLEDVRKRVGVVGDSLDAALASAPELPPEDQAFIVVSLAENRVWYKRGAEVLFTTRIASGSGKTLVKEGSNSVWKFDTPRGRFAVTRKDIDPQWVPPDWHFVEQARKRGLGLKRLNRGETYDLPDGSAIVVQGNDVVKRTPDGQTTPLSATDGREIVAGGNIIIPPFGTNQRKYPDVLGTHRLYLHDGYALHGTNNPSSIGQSVSHGCIRLTNEDIAKLFSMVELGTPVYIY